MMPHIEKTQTGLIEANLPVYVQCLRMPAEWRRASHLDTSYPRLAGLAHAEPNQQNGDLLLVSPARGKAESYDPWEKRSEFFRLEKGNTDALLDFLSSVGYFSSCSHLNQSEKLETVERSEDGLTYFAEYTPKISESHIWAMRRLFENSVKKGEHSGKHSDFPLRIVTEKSNPRLVVTPTTFEDALALTLSIDAVRHAKRQKCARPDCGVPFTFTGGHSRKYCCWYCGHIESVRNSRKRAKKQKRTRKEP